MLGKPAFPLWESHYLLSVSNTCKQQAVGYLSKKKTVSVRFAQSCLSLLWGNQGSYKWNAAVKHMIRTQDEISFWQNLVFRV